MKERQSLIEGLGKLETLLVAVIIQFYCICHDIMSHKDYFLSYFKNH